MVSKAGGKRSPVNPEKRAGHSISPETWDQFLNGSRLACARLISLVENHPEFIPEVRNKLIPHQKGAVRVGITGPPGVGKSTVTTALVRRALKENHSIGVIAVDPSSPFTGGAFLGDRVRMQSLSGDTRVFIRSLASRDGHGGLSPSTPYAADILDAFGMDRILIETVGVGQAELDVLTCSDMIILVLQPGTGDIIQALKAGILEIGDIFLVNKADLPGTETLLESLRFLFEINAGRKDKPAPPILTASAIQDRGMDEVYAEMERAIRGIIRSGALQKKKRDRMEREIRESIQQNLWERFSALMNAPEEIQAVSERLLENRQSPYPYIRNTCAQIEIKFTKERPCHEDGE